MFEWLYDIINLYSGLYEKMGYRILYSAYASSNIGFIRPVYSIMDDKSPNITYSNAQTVVAEVWLCHVVAMKAPDTS